MFKLGFFGQRSPMFIKNANAVNSIVIQSSSERRAALIPSFSASHNFINFCKAPLFRCLAFSQLRSLSHCSYRSSSVCWSLFLAFLKLLQPTYTSRERKIKTAGSIPGVSKSWTYTLARWGPVFSLLLCWQLLIIGLFLKLYTDSKHE